MIDLSQETTVFLAQGELTADTNFNLLRILSEHTENDPIQVRDSLIRVLDQWARVPAGFRDAWMDLVEAVGLYPYMNPELLLGSTALRYEFHRSPNRKEIVFHSEQRKVWNTLANSRSAILSAPTSFGKSLLIEEIIASNKYNNIVIIQPTLALLDETRNKLYKYKKDYKLILSTAEHPGNRNIFLLTAERVVDYKEFPPIDFFIIDEFYKLSSSRDDERSIALNVALYRLLKSTKNFYFLGPNIYKIPDDFTDTYNATWIKSDFATVAVDIEKIVGPRGGVIPSGKSREEKLFELLESLEGQTIVYCSKPQRTVDLANKFRLFTKNKNIVNDTISTPVAEITEWIAENIHKDWSLIDNLKAKIAFHHSAIPRHLSVSIIDLFNDGDIKYLFCTSTIIEGVNTSAKNVVVFDAAKGQKPIDYFDFKNISGRSGRMSKHYVGKVFQFEDAPEESNLIVDIPFFTQDKAPLELLIYLDEEDVKDENRGKLFRFNALSDEEKQLITSNFGVPFEGQIAVLDMLKEDNGELHNLLSWKTYPSWDNINKTIEICFNHLLFKKGGNFTSKQIAMKVQKFLQYKSIKVLIDTDINSDYNTTKYPDYFKRVQHSVESNLYLVRNWFSFTLPKCLGVLDNIQRYVFESKGLSSGNYKSAINAIENRFSQENLTPLLDYSLPSSILTKLKRHLDPDLTFEQILSKLSTLDLNKLGLLSYERKLIEKLTKKTDNSFNDF